MCNEVSHAISSCAIRKSCHVWTHKSILAEKKGSIVNICAGQNAIYRRVLTPSAFKEISDSLERKCFGNHENTVRIGQRENGDCARRKTTPKDKHIWRNAR